MKTRRFALAAGVLALGLLFAACSDDSDDSSAGATGDTEQAMTTEMSEADIVDTAVAAGDFTTLVSAVQAAGLEQTLRGQGPFTVFAPTDAAFEALPPGTVDALLANPTGDLTSILTYHVVPGVVMAADVMDLNGQPVTTVNGATFSVGVADGSVTLTDATGQQVEVVKTDIETTNGVIHVIDAVLMPK